MKKTLVLFALFAAFSVTVGSQLEAKNPILADDSDLSAQTTQLLSLNQLEELEWELFDTDSRDRGAELQILRRFGDELTAVQGMLFTRVDNGQQFFSDQSGVVRIPLCLAGSMFQLRMETQDSHFNIQGPNGNYTKLINIKCLTYNLALASEDSALGQLLGIWQIAYKGKQKLQASVGLDFWSQTLNFNWPASGDYYGGSGRLYISSGHHWDVVAHEMGHAIYDLANVGVFGGGQHYIDRCYTNAMALSEGWASYYAAFITLDRDDEDAKFQYLVPRRAPIGVEHVPDDVCRQPTNEWRVMSFLWDLYDVNADPEQAEYSFKTIWDVTTNGQFRSILGISNALKNAGFDPVLVDQAWDNNF